jgi:hypothetical protein
VSDERAVRILDRASELSSGRSNFETMWQEIAERILPGAAAFNVMRTPGEKRTEKMFDATAALALRKFATIIESLLTPRNQKWHKLVAEEEGLAEDDEVKRYFDDLTKVLFRARYAPTANFTGQIGSMYLDLGAFGTSSLFVEDDRGLTYRTMPLAETLFTENSAGLIEALYRKFTYTAAQAVQKFGDRCPPKVREAAQRSPQAPFNFVHCVEPINEENGKGLPKGMRFASTYVSEADKLICKEGGYYTQPFVVARDLTSAGEIYGRSPSTWILPDVKMLNEMNKTIIRAAHKAVDPPIMLQEDGALSAFDLRPGALNPGGLGTNGEELAKPFVSGADIGLGLDLLQAKQAMVNEAYFITLFQILIESRNMTATEVMERAQEKGMLLGPLMGRQQSEFLGPLIEREIDIAARRGDLPPMPDALLEAGGLYKVEYESPLARAQRAEEGVAIMRTVEGLQAFVATNPEILDNFDLDEISRTLGEVNGMAAKLFRPRDAVEELRAQRAQQQQAAMMAEAAPGVARAAKDVSEIAA